MSDLSKPLISSDGGDGLNDDQQGSSSAPSSSVNITVTEDHTTSSPPADEESTPGSNDDNFPGVPDEGFYVTRRYTQEFFNEEARERARRKSARASRTGSFLARSRTAPHADLAASRQADAGDTPSTSTGSESIAAGGGNYADDNADGEDALLVTKTGTTKSIRNNSYVISEVMDQKRYIEAGIFLREAELFGNFDFHPRTEEQQKVFLYIASTKHMVIEAFVAIIYLLIVLFEEPAVVELSPHLTGTVEMFCVLLYLTNLFLKSRVCGSLYNFFMPVDMRNESLEVFLHNSGINRRVAWGHIFRVILAVAMLISAIVSMALDVPSYLSIGRALLVLDIQILTGCRRVLRLVFQSLWHIRWMLALCLLFITISSILAFHFFSPNRDDENFRSLDDSFMSLFVLITTANYPDVMMKAFAWTRLAPLFFVAYLLMGLYMIFNIFLAFVFGFYQNREKNKFKKLYLRRRRAIRLAFQCALDSSESGLTMRAFREIVKVYDPSKSSQSIVLAYAIMDRSRDGRLQLGEFYKFYQVMHIEWKVNYQRTGLEEENEYGYLPTRGWPRWRLQLREIVLSKGFKFFFNVAIIGNVIYMLIEAATAKHKSDHSVELQDPWVVYLFYAVFLVEAVVKILGLGFTAYFSQGWNIFDFSIVFLSTFFFIIEAAYDQAQVGPFATVIRGFRLARVIKTQATFKNIAEVMAFVFPKMMRFVGALLLVYFMFAIIGMQSFAHTVSKKCGIECYDNTSYYDNTEPDGLHFQLLSFDNVLYSYNTLFHLMVVNNWFITMEGHVNATGTKAARIFFIVYYLVMVLVVSNIVIAFILDAFQVLFDQRSDKDSDGFKYMKRQVNVPVARDVAAQFLPADHKALKHDVVYFKGRKRNLAIYNILYKDEITQWDEADDALADFREEKE